MMEKMKLKELVKQFIPMNYWNTRRKASIIRQQGKVADFWAPILKAYYNGEIERYSLKPKKKLGTQKVIWQYWGQGIDKDELPEIIQICFDSVDRNKNDYQVIRLTDITISEYIDLPDFVWRKREYVQFTRTFFSDLLRVALLSTYGGVWLDATILLTGSIPAVYEKTDFFIYASGIACKIPVCSHNTVTRHDYRHGIVSHSTADRLCGHLGNTTLFCHNSRNFTVGHNRAVGNCQENIPYSLAKL